MNREILKLVFVIISFMIIGCKSDGIQKLKDDTKGKIKLLMQNHSKYVKPYKDSVDLSLVLENDDVNWIDIYIKKDSIEIRKFKDKCNILITQVKAKEKQIEDVSHEIDTLFNNIRQKRKNFKDTIKSRYESYKNTK